MKNILINSPRFPEALTEVDILPFTRPVDDFELMRLFYLIDRQMEEVGTCDHSFEKLDTALDFTKTTKEAREAIYEVLKTQAGCDCEIMLNLSWKVADRIEAEKSKFVNKIYEIGKHIHEAKQKRIRLN